MNKQLAYTYDVLLLSSRASGGDLHGQVLRHVIRSKQNEFTDAQTKSKPIATWLKDTPAVINKDVLLLAFGNTKLQSSRAGGGYLDAQVLRHVIRSKNSLRPRQQIQCQ